jgi:hypothetical protein
VLVSDEPVMIRLLEDWERRCVVLTKEEIEVGETSKGYTSFEM